MFKCHGREHLDVIDTLTRQCLRSVYAATMLKFAAQKSTHPIKQLDIVLRPLSLKSESIFGTWLPVFSNSFDASRPRYVGSGPQHHPYLQASTTRNCHWRKGEALVVFEASFYQCKKKIYWRICKLGDWLISNNPLDMLTTDGSYFGSVMASAGSPPLSVESTDKRQSYSECSTASWKCIPPASRITRVISLASTLQYWLLNQASNQLSKSAWLIGSEELALSHNYTHY
jgi:hypothetical protein